MFAANSIRFLPLYGIEIKRFDLSHDAADYVILEIDTTLIH